MKNPIFRKLHSPPQPRVNLAKLLGPRLVSPSLQKNGLPAPAVAARPRHDDGTPLSEAVHERLDRGEAIQAIGKVLAGPGIAVVPGWSRR